MSETLEMKKHNFENLLKSDSQLASQKSGLESLGKLDYPTPKTEAWKYTRTNKISKVNWKAPASTFKGDIRSYVLDASFDILFFYNGYFHPGYSRITQDIEVKMGDEAQDKVLSIENSDASIFYASNAAICNDPVVISIPEKTILDKPIQVVFLSDGEDTMNAPHLFIESNAFSEAKFIFSFNSLDDNCSFTNYALEGIVKKNAKLVIDKLQLENFKSFHVGNERILQEKDSHFHINTVTLGGELTRNDLNIDVTGENCETNLYGLYITKDNQHVDNHTCVDHTTPNCISNEWYKGIMDDKSTGVFNGKVFVRKDAQKINAFQQNNNILLSDHATINSKPELEIYADDVKCSHGSTTGQFDDEAIFYLRARGIKEDSARKLMIKAFAEDVLENIALEPVHDKIEEQLNAAYNWKF